jgi:hypothetical protein
MDNADEKTPEQKAAAEQLSKEILESFSVVQLSLVHALTPVIMTAEQIVEKVRAEHGAESARSVQKAWYAMLGRALMEQAVYAMTMSCIDQETARELFENLWQACADFDPVARQEVHAQRSAGKVGAA